MSMLSFSSWDDEHSEPTVISFVGGDNSFVIHDLELSDIKRASNFDISTLHLPSEAQQASLKSLTMYPARNYGPSSFWPKGSEFSRPQAVLLPRHLPKIEGSVGTGWARVDLTTSTGELYRVCYSGNAGHQTHPGSAMSFQHAMRYAPDEQPSNCQANRSQTEGFNFLIPNVRSVFTNLDGGGVHPSIRRYTELRLDAFLIPAQSVH